MEEALSSLLWQPYEYQGARSDSTDTISSSESSASSNTSSNNLAAWLSQLGNAADPNLSLQMVSNLMALKPGAVGSQSRREPRPRDHHGNAKVGYGARTNSLRCAPAANGDSVTVTECCGEYDAVLSVFSDMRLEIGGENKPPDVLPGGNDANNRCLFPCVSTDMIPSNMTSVVSANVVGLPVAHSRSSSNIATRNTDQVSHHPRSASEVLVLGSHFRSTTNVAHPRQASGGSARGMSEPPPNTNPELSVFNSPEVNITHASDNLVPTQEVKPAEGSRVPPLPNVSTVNVNFYRAVPVNVVSSVPTINCLNSVEESGNNVSNVHIVQAMPSVSVTVKPEVRTRTFTSTEAQTDDTAVGGLTAQPQTSTREQRRRERRERRHQRRLNATSHQHSSGAVMPPPANSDRLPDLLNSHLPPPYTTLPGAGGAAAAMPGAAAMPAAVPPPPPPPIPYQVPLVPGPPPPVPIPAATGFRFSFPSAAGFRR